MDTEYFNRSYFSLFYIYDYKTAQNTDCLQTGALDKGCVYKVEEKTSKLIIHVNNIQILNQTNFKIFYYHFNYNHKHLCGR
ncbi:hypothetical protein GMMP15_440042 [Candidatus Magnetomoraceae bacterium gMMP-15]